MRIGRRNIFKTALASGIAGALLPAPARSAQNSPAVGADGVYNICFLGDSYTSGTGSTDGNGYRKFLIDALHTNNETRNIRCVGSQASTGKAGWGSVITLPHEGRPGWTTQSLRSLVSGGGLDYPQGQPSLVFLLAGANDFGAGSTPTEVRDDLEALVDTILALNPGLGIVLSEHPLMSSYTSTVLTERSRQGQELNSLLPALVAAKAGRVLLARGSLLDQQDLHTDGVHLNNGGYQRLGYVMYRALAPWFGRDGQWLVPVKQPWAPGPDPLK